MQKNLRALFGQRVKQLRIASGLSQEAFADRCGFARSYMSRIERGESNASLDAIETLARALEVDVAVLFLPNSVTAVQNWFVPYAKDGSCFNPGLASSRDGSYVVGEPNNLQRFSVFEDALAYLKTMQTAKWKRPNSKGNWAIVSAIRWDKLSEDNLMTPKWLF